MKHRIIFSGAFENFPALSEHMKLFFDDLREGYGDKCEIVDIKYATAVIDGSTITHSVMVHYKIPTT